MLAVPPRLPQAVGVTERREGLLSRDPGLRWPTFHGGEGERGDGRPHEEPAPAEWHQHSPSDTVTPADAALSLGGVREGPAPTGLDRGQTAVDVALDGKAHLCWVALFTPCKRSGVSALPVPG